MGTVLVVGGYGNAGAAITRLLLAHSDHAVRVGGRHPHRAQAPRRGAGRGGCGVAGPGRVGRAWMPRTARAWTARWWAWTCASPRPGPPAAPATAVAAAVSAGVDYLDIQVGHAKARQILAMDARAREAGVTLVTDGGFHPGVPAAMVRYADQRMGGIERALVASVIAVDWAALRPLADSTVAR